MDADKIVSSIKTTFLKVLKMMLKNSLRHQIIWWEKKKRPLSVRKKVSGLMKDETGGKIII